jgi:hypothetical protein
MRWSASGSACHQIIPLPCSPPLLLLLFSDDGWWCDRGLRDGLFAPHPHPHYTCCIHHLTRLASRPPPTAYELYINSSSLNPWFVDYHSLHELFSRYGLVHELYIVWDESAARARNSEMQPAKYAMLRYYTRHDADHAIR